MTIKGDAGTACLAGHSQYKVYFGPITKIFVSAWVLVLSGELGFSHDVGCNYSVVKSSDCNKNDPKTGGWIRIEKQEINACQTGPGYLCIGRKQGSKDDLDAYIALPYLTASNLAWAEDCMSNAQLPFN